jgi:hypothetical protein
MFLWHSPEEPSHTLFQRRRRAGEPNMRENHRMRTAVLLALAACGVSWAGPEPQAPADPFEQMTSLVGEWQADLAAYGQILDSIRLVSKGTAVEETLGTPSDNEVSLYTRDGKRLLLTHVCALTPDGHVARLESGALRRSPAQLAFTLVSASNLHDAAAPHMRRVLITFVDRDHFREEWTKTEKGVDTVFDLSFSRRQP